MFTGKSSSGSGQSKANQAKVLLARYGSAYLLSILISFAIVSFGILLCLGQQRSRCCSPSLKGMDALKFIASLAMWHEINPKPCAVDRWAYPWQVGLSVTDTSEKVGTFAIAYAAHKALSPVRFPPTVALTPVVAKMLGKEPAAAADEAPED